MSGERIFAWSLYAAGAISIYSIFTHVGGEIWSWPGLGLIIAIACVAMANEMLGRLKGPFDDA